jgi:transcriptional regulator with XRE-family HTH domain
MKKSRSGKPPGKAARGKKPGPRRAGDDDFITGAIDSGRSGDAPASTRLAKASLGARIREARELRALTLEDLSSRTGLSVEMLERVESGRATPALGALVRVGKALEMQMGHFISTGVDRPMSVVRAESRPRIARRSQRASEQYGYVYESLAPEKANRLMEPFLVTMSPTEFEEASSHDGQEFLFVLAGEISVRVDEEVEVLRAGDSVYYDSSHPHLVKCHGREPAKILAVIYAGDG